MAFWWIDGQYLWMDWIRSVWIHLSSKFIWGQDKDKTLLILKEKEKAGALPAGRR